MIQTPNEQDGEEILSVTAGSGVFSPEEIECVAELWQENQQSGAAASGYHFRVFRRDGQMLGYICYGPRALADGVFDLYWLAVAPQARGQGVARALIADMEQTLASQGGRIIVVETSSTPPYSAARQTYLHCGYVHEATLRDFYHPGDDLVIFTKHLEGGRYDQPA